MGGVGSGRRGACERLWTTSSFVGIDVRRWGEAGLLHQGSCFRWVFDPERDDFSALVRVGAKGVLVSLDQESRRVDTCASRRGDQVGLVWTPCHFGGHRPWFVCPVEGCGRRVAILYLGHALACRRCSRLVYQSQREGPCDRAVRRAVRLRQRLQWDPDPSKGPGLKPIRMHWRTFLRLEDQYIHWFGIALEGMMDHLERVQRDCERLADSLFKDG